MKIFAITCSVHTNTLWDAELFSTPELAKARLKKIKNERRNNMGVHVHKDSATEFSFTLGWEEHHVQFSIIELNVDKE
jgi:CRISPR/Cas system-associated protein Cas10 (large subunit of type III CRISPR-Cas system)